MTATAALDQKRGLVRSLISPHPLGESLPALYQEDDFTQRFVSAFDAALAPIFASLDNLPAYLDPWLAPEDFLEWLGGWFGIVLDESWSTARRRALVSRAFEFYRLRGTAGGLKEQVEVLTGGSVDLRRPRPGHGRRPGYDQPGQAGRAGHGGQTGPCHT